MSAPVGPRLPPVTVAHFEDRRPGRRELGGEIIDDHYVAALTLRQSRLEVTYNGRVLQDGMVFPGMMRLAGPGERVHVVLHAHSEAVTVRIPGPTLRAARAARRVPHRPGAVSYLDPLPRPSAQVAQLGRMFLAHAEFDPAHAALLLDGLTQALLAHLFHGHGWSRREPPAAKRLTAAELRRAVAFAEGRMREALPTGEALTLEAWAGHLRLPVAEFRQRFYATTGQMPYAWYLRRRIERAKELLADSRESLTEIALRVGFSSQSHFTEAFRRLEGVPPARWRGRSR